MTATLDGPVRGSRSAAQGQGCLASPGTSWAERLVTPLPPDRVLGWIVALGIGLLAGFLRFYHLGRLLWMNDPSGQKLPAGTLTGTFKDKDSGCIRYFQNIFDETYYHHDALSLLHRGVEQNCQNTGQGFVVHPPVGKWLIAGGIKVFGDNPFGWRFAAALAGTLSVIILTRLARRLFGSTLLGAFAGLLLALDGLEFVMSRVALLDIFVMFMELVALACLVLDREHGRRRLAVRLPAAGNPYPGPRLGFRHWRLATAVFLGLSVAVKWSGLYIIPAFAALAFAWDVGARRTAGIRSPVRATIRKDWLGWVPSYTAIPVAAYTASWTGWFLGSDATAWDRHNVTLHGQTVRRSGVVGSTQNWLAYQCDAYNFHKNLTDNDHYGGGVFVPIINFCKDPSTFHAAGKLHPYLSKPVGWLFLSRPVDFYFEQPGRGQAGCHTDKCVKQVLAIGTPAIWWASIAALLVVLGIWLARRDWRAALILVTFTFGFFPWMLNMSRQMFLFYALPILPVMILAITMVAGLILGGPGSSERRRRVGAAAVGGYLLLVIANFFFLYPILAGDTISYSAWQARMWFPGWI